MATTTTRVQRTPMMELSVKADVQKRKQPTTAAYSSKKHCNTGIMDYKDYAYSLCQSL